jgi:hypothetical protein
MTGVNHPTGERCYTLDEARHELGRQECLMHGHDFEVISARDMANAAGEPISVHCPRCGTSWACSENHSPDVPGFPPGFRPQVPNK